MKRPDPKHPALWIGLGTAGAVAAGSLLQAVHSRRIARDPENEALEATPKGRPQSVRSADGTRLHVEVFGPDDGETVVLAHGWTEALRFWIYVIRRLERKGLRVVAYDLRGHGDSAPASGGDCAIPRFGEDLEAVLEGCVPAGRRAVVAGHSLGAMSIASWANQHDVEARVRAAALLSTGVGDLIAEHLLLPLPGIAQALGRAISVRGFLRNKTPLPRFSTPAVAARRIAEMLPQLRRLAVLEHAGHMTPLERPDVVTEALAELAGLTTERVPA